MKLFKTITTVSGCRESFVDWIELSKDDNSSPENLREIWVGMCAEVGIDTAMATVQFIECSPETLKPISN